MCFYAFLGKVKDRSHLQIALAYPERPLHNPQSVILFNNSFLWQIGIGNISLKTVPSGIFRYLCLVNLNLYILANREEFVISPSVDVLFCQFAASVSLL